MNKRVYIYVPGILSRPGNAEGWTDRAVTWTHVNTPYRAEKYEYWSGVLFRRLHQQQRADKLVRMMSYYGRDDWDIVLVGHSNGCDVITRALKDRPEPIEELHYYAPAVEADMALPIVRDRLCCGTLHKFRLHIGGRDLAMRMASWSRRAFGWIGLGYGALGGMSAEMIRKQLPICLPHEVEIVTWAAGAHGDWFRRGRRFQQTMREIMAA